jgi:uracil phosphoribosyltransferase
MRKENAEEMQTMSNLHVFDHPLIQHKMTFMRKVETGTKQFRELVDEVASFMAYDIRRDLPLTDVAIETSVTKTTQKMIEGKKLGIVPILRAGLGMVDGMLRMMPNVKVGHIALYREPETLEPTEYYLNLPTDVAERDFVVVDPMHATGRSAADAISSLKKLGAKSIKLA